MLKNVIPNYDSELSFLNHLAPSGYTLAFNVGFNGAELFSSSYPEEWQRIYERRSYYFVDPILIWGVTKVGVKRWSEVKFPDVRGVMRAATEFGITYGGVFATKIGSGKSILTASRADREFSDDEMSLLAEKLNYMAEFVVGKSGLTDKELDVLREMSTGLGYKEISEKLKISLPTVKSRADKARTKLKANTTTQAVAIAAVKNYI